ncbi:hypothetical protein KAS42_04825 [bacterium]|nr:hypothetical protein [bacterium]
MEIRGNIIETHCNKAIYSKVFLKNTAVADLSALFIVVCSGRVYSANKKSEASPAP